MNGEEIFERKKGHGTQMHKTKYLILGAGPAGLAFAGRLRQNGETSFLLLEQEEQAGGLCRSMQVDGTPLDIGGGHFLDVRRPGVNEFLFRYMPMEEWDRYERNSLIAFDGGYIGHPFEANIWQMKEERQQEFLASIAEAGCNKGEPMPEQFVEWIYWKLGQRIAEEYMLPYNEKMFGSDLDQLGTYWLAKLPNVSYEETKLSCVNKKAYGEQPGHASFYYPKKFGYGELWLRMQADMKDHILTGQAAADIDFNDKTVTCADGGRFQAEYIITTVPWTGWKQITGMPEELKAGIEKLKFSSLEICYHEESLPTNAQWIYYPDKAVPWHRVLVRHNFCPGGKGYWTETNLANTSDTGGSFRYVNQYAYPLNTKSKPEIMSRLLAFAREKQVYGLGRWGEHEHYNSDAVVELALALADSFTQSCAASD